MLRIIVADMYRYKTENVHGTSKINKTLPNETELHKI